MAGKSAGFAISIGIQDSASAGLDGINKRIAAMQAPAERFNKSLAKFGEVTGINRAAEGMQTLGDRALGAARSVERLAGPMAGVTSVLSLGGIAEMSRRWADAGNAISKTSDLLNTPVPRLSALHGAARLAGSSVEAMDASLAGLGKTLSDAQNFRASAPVVALLNKFHIGFGKVGEAARPAADALGEVADAVASYQDPHAQARLLEQLGIDKDLLPLLQNGPKGLEEYLATARRTGGVMTTEMADAAKKMHASWEELGLALEGGFNRIGGSWSGTITKMLDTSSHWIEGNKERFDRNVQYATEAIVAIGAIKAAPWILRALGWLLPGEVLGVPTAPIALPLALGGDTADNPEARIPYDPITNPNLFDRYGAGGLWWASHMPGWLGGGGLPSNRGAGPRVGAAPTEPAVPYQAGAILGSMGITSGQYSAFREGIARIEHARYNQMGGAGDRYAGRYQMGPAEIAETARRLFVPVPTREQFLADPAMQERFFEAYTAAHNDQLMRDSGRYRAMTPEQRLEVLRYAHNQGVGGAEAWLETSQVGRDAFGMPGTAYADAVAAALSAANLGSAPNGVPGVGPVFGPQAAANGHVTVDIRLHGAPPGTTASVVTSGGVVAPAPGIETSMPLAR